MHELLPSSVLAFARGPLSRSLTWPLFGCASGSLLSIVSGHCIKPVVLNSCLPMRSASLRGPPRRGARRLAGPGFFQGSSQLAGSGGLRGPPFSPGRGRLAGSASFRAPLRIAHNTHTRTRARTHVHTRTRARALSHTHTHAHTHTHRHTRARSMRQACAPHRCSARRLTELALASRCRHYGPSQTVQWCTLLHPDARVCLKA